MQLFLKAQISYILEVLETVEIVAESLNSTESKKLGSSLDFWEVPDTRKFRFLLDFQKLVFFSSHGVIERVPGEYWVIGAGESLQSEVCVLGTFPKIQKNTENFT